MIEVEVKVKLKDLNTFKKSLLKLGAEKLKEQFEEDIYFKHPSVDFKETDEALRLRRVSGTVNLTYKGPRLTSESKTREELNVEVYDFNTCKLLFEKLRFQVLAEIFKKREVYALGDVKVYVDMVKGLGEFAEFEIMVEDEKRVKAAEEKVFNLVEELGFKRADSVTSSYLELIMGNITL
ncbi:MAG: class IV adenylate cyclase [Candidatus Odinarchaeum yellowstonii]|uniref:Class IV adenylate cyclase n=1 Tax=Odinarchaeota yellowstonii (strain LCB_4) TaxID=1841599 RepID=A0AAF0IBV1_ODILC|nr:MAG: class IV adenylate cyclase [Candidatus Odinarchaeum yellowstonii]